MKKIPLYPRIDYAIKKAREFLIKSDIRSLPVDPLGLYKKHGWEIKSISEIKDLSLKYKSPNINYELNCDAKTYLTDKGQYLTIYDDAVFTSGRVLWTLGHEIGHIDLKHMEDFEQTKIHVGLSDTQNKVLEAEANIFVSELLAPPEILLLCNCTSKDDIIKLCNLSGEAAENKETCLSKYKSKAIHDSINNLVFKQFYDYTSTKMYYHKVHINICPSCRNYILKSSEHFCRICGRQINFKTLGRGFIYNDGFETHSTKGSVICPVCDGNAQGDQRSICSKCGAMLINKCSSNNDDCPKVHESSSRYCYHCGGKTTFYLNGYLKPFEECRKDIFIKTKYADVIYNDNKTGTIFKDWNFILKSIREDGEFQLYHLIKDSIAKIDYDTLYIFTDKEKAVDTLNIPTNVDYLMKLAHKNTGIPILEIITEKIDCHI